MNKEKIMQILNSIDLGLNIIEEGQQLDKQALTESVRTDVEDLKVKVDVDMSDLKKKIEALKMEKRVIKGWTEHEINYLDTKRNSGSNLVDVIKNAYIEHGTPLHSKYARCTSRNEANKFVTDIVDYFNGRAKFPDEKYILETTTKKSNTRTYIKGIWNAPFVDKPEADNIVTTADKSEAVKLTEDEIISKLGQKFMVFAKHVEAQAWD